MTASLPLIVAAAVMIGCGVYLILERSLSRVLIGVLMLGNGINVLFLVSGGPAGQAPIVGRSDPQDMSDPLPQALVLTAIVIALGTTAFMLAMAYRSWQLTGHDDVQDDVEDRAIRRRALDDESSESYELFDDDIADDDIADDVVPVEGQAGGGDGGGTQRTPMEGRYRR